MSADLPLSRPLMTSKITIPLTFYAGMSEETLSGSPTATRDIRCGYSTLISARDSWAALIEMRYPVE